MPLKNYAGVGVRLDEKVFNNPSKEEVQSIKKS
jgi:hypothetical protein